MVIPVFYRRLFWLACLVACAEVAAAVCLTGSLSVQREYDQSELIFIGHVISEKATGQSTDYFEGSTYVISVDEALKGKPPAEVEVFSENSTGRFPMEIGQRYLVFACRALGRLTVDNCGNSGLFVEKGEAIEAIRRMTKQMAE